MVQPVSKFPQSHSLRYLAAGGLAVAALAWGLGFFSSEPSSHTATNAMARDKVNAAAASYSLGKEDFDSKASNSSATQSFSSATSLPPMIDSVSQPPNFLDPNRVLNGAPPSPAMLSQGNSLEGQLQAQRSAELHELFPVEATPSAATAPPAAPGVANPHQ